MSTTQLTLDEVGTETTQSPETPETPGSEPETVGFDMEQYERELDSIVAEVIPGKEDPLA